MTRLAHCFRLSLLALCFVVFGTYPASAQEENRSIKLLDVDDEYINLDVDGRRVRIPLPDGYVVADKQLYSNLYKNIKNKTDTVDDILLCVLVQIDENLNKQENRDYKSRYYAYFRIDNEYIDCKADDDMFIGEIDNIKSLTKTLMEESNQHMAEKGRSTFSYDFLFESDNFFSILKLEDWASQTQCRFGVAENYIYIDQVIITFLMYHVMCDENGTDRLKDEIVSYGRRINR